MLKLCKRFLALIVLVLMVFAVTSCNEEVDDSLKKINLNESAIVMTVGDVKTLATKYLENDVEKTAKIDFKSSNLAVVAIDGGKLVAVSAGQAVVTAYVVGHDNINAECSVTVQDKIVEPDNEVKHALTIDLDGGSYEDAPTEFVEGVELRLQAPVKEGYRFKGYQKGEEIVLKLTGEDKADVALKAIWEKIDERAPLTTGFDVKSYAELEALVPEAGNTTTEKYYAIGYVKVVETSNYGNFYIEDAEGNQLYIYGTYDQDNNVRYDKMAVKPTVGDIVVVYGVMTNFKGTKEMKNVALVEWNSYVFEHQSKEHRVALILGDGKVEKDITSYTTGQAVTLPTPVKEGYEFLGWYNGTAKVTEIAADSKTDLVLVASWKKIETKTYSIVSDLNGGKLESNFGVSIYATPITTLGIVKAGASYGAVDATLPYVAKLSELNPMNGLRYQPKAYIKYNAGYKAWEIIKVDQATANSTNLGMVGVAEYVIGGSSNSTLNAIASDKSYEGKFVVFDQDITALPKGDVAVVAKVYSKDDFADNGVMPTAISSGQEFALPTPSKGSYYNFLGWYEGETKVEKLVGNKNYNIVAKYEEIVIEHALTLNEVDGTLEAYKVVEGEPYAKLHIAKFGNLYTNDGEKAYVAAILNNLADGANSLRWQYKLVLAYDAKVGAYQIVGADAATKTLADMAVIGQYVIASVTDPAIIALAVNPAVVGKYVVFNNDLDKLSVEDVDLYASIADAKQIVAGSALSKYNEGSELVLPALSRVGKWHFVGWTDGTSTFNAIPADMKADLNLNPVWAKVVIKHNINWELNGGACANLPTEFVEGDEDIVLPTPTKAGYVFTGWEINETEVTAIDGDYRYDVKVVATWCKEGVLPKYALTLNLDGGALAEAAPTEYESGKKLILPIPTKDYCDFVGWKYGNVFIKRISEMQSGNVELTAVWSKHMHNITYTTNGVGSLTGAPSQYFEGEGVAALPELVFDDNFSVFYGWYVGETKVTSIPVGDTKDYDLVAKYGTGTVKIGSTYYPTLNAAIQAAKDGDELVLKAGEHLMTATSTAKITIVGPNKGIKYNGARQAEASIYVNQAQSDNYSLKNASIVFDGVRIASKISNTSTFYPTTNCTYAEFRNVIIESEYTGTSYKINSFFRMNNNTTVPMEIKFTDCAIHDIDQFIIMIYANKTIANVTGCDIQCNEAVGSQLFRIKANCADSVINVMDCQIQGPTTGYICKAESGTINIAYNRIYNNNTDGHLKPTCDGTINYTLNFFDNSSKTSGSKASNEKARAQAYYDYLYKHKLVLNTNNGVYKVGGVVTDMPVGGYYSNEETYAKALPVLEKEGEVFLGWYDANGVKYTKYADLKDQDMELTAKFAKHLIDWADGKIGSGYTSSKWKVEQYNSSWDVVTSTQMNCREKNGVKVVNIVSGWSMERRFTYTPDQSMGIINSIEFVYGNYFSGAQNFPVKVVLFDKDGNEKYVVGSATEFVQLPVTTGLQQLSVSFDNFEVSKVRFIVKSKVNGSAYLYLGPIAFEQNETVYSFTEQTGSNSSYSNTWKYGDVTIVGGANNSAAWSFIKMGGSKTNLEKVSEVYMALPELANDASQITVKIGGFGTAECFNKAETKCSIKVICYSDAEMTQKVSESEAKEAPAVAKNGSPQYVVFDGNWAKGSYIKVVFECTNTTTTNGVTCVQYIAVK